LILHYPHKKAKSHFYLFLYFFIFLFLYFFISLFLYFFFTYFVRAARQAGGGFRISSLEKGLPGQVK